MEHSCKWLLDFLWSSKQQNQWSLFDERKDRNEDKNSYEDRTDRIGNLPSKVLNQDRRNDHANTAQRIGQNVKENACNQRNTESYIPSKILFRSLPSLLSRIKFL